MDTHECPGRAIPQAGIRPSDVELLYRSLAHSPLVVPDRLRGWLRLPFGPIRREGKLGFTKPIVSGIAGRMKCPVPKIDLASYGLTCRA